METVKIACEGAGLLSIDEMTEIQGELKSLSKKNYERLKKEILETGVGFPIRIWRAEGKLNIVGGTQTRRTLIRMRNEEGYDIPRIPVSYVHAKDFQEAMRRVLQDVTQYGQIERQGLYEFLHNSEIDFQMVEANFDLPNLDMESFKFEFYQEDKPITVSDGGSKSESKDEPEKRAEDENPIEKDKQTYLSNNIKQVVLFYEGSRFEEVINKANALLDKMGLEDFSALFLALIDKESKDADHGIEEEISEPETVDEEVASA